MKKHETPFVTTGDLILLEALVTGPRRTSTGRFVLDTGAATTTITPELAHLIGYSARDGIQRTHVRTALGSEEGYILLVAEFDVLGFPMLSFRVNVFDLGYEDLDGLIGMNFLNELNYEVRSVEKRILTERI